jgi:formate dehydrogenase subunit delta
MNSPIGSMERLVYMANQIARNLIVGGHGHAVATTADHIASFWDPRMKAMIFAHLEAGGEGLSDAARDAITLLRDRGAPAHQTAATESGGSDAG